MTRMLTEDSLEQKWNGLAKQVGGFMRVDPVHPIELYIGYEGPSQKSLLLISTVEPPDWLTSSKSILVTSGRRHDGKWAVTFRLVRSEQEEVFIHLCSDLIEACRGERNDRAGVQVLLNRYRLWHRLMEYQGSGLLSDPARKGLLGELLFLQRLLVAGMPAADAVKGWVGPDGADRDFVYASGWHEVKATVVSAKSVLITSLDQLDAAPPGELAVFLIDHAAPDESGSFSLNDKVSEVRDALQAEPATAELFGTKLAAVGYLPLREYDTQRYRLHSLRRYTVDESFPRLTKQNAPSEVVSATYEISLSAVESWRSE